jgi:phospholipase/carboxylesterase
MIQVSTPEAHSVCGLKHKVRLTSTPAAPLAFLVHGRAGTCDVMWPFARCVPENFNIIAPEAFLPDPVGGFSWWSAEQFGDREAIMQGVTKLSEFMAAAVKYYELQPAFAVALGFSQGAGALSCLVQTNPEMFRAVALLAGFVVDLDRNPAADLRFPKILMAHGTQDTVVSLDKASRGAEVLRRYGASVELHTDDVGHKVGSQGMRQLKEFLHGL